MFFYLRHVCIYDINIFKKWRGFMALRDKFEERIKKKELEVQELESKTREAKAYLQALQDSIKLLPKEEKVGVGSIVETLRSGSNVHKTYELLKKMGKPMHLNEILKAIGKGTSKTEKVNLAGSLGGYVRKGEIFTRPAPNTFGLISMEDILEPPDDFGTEEKKVNIEDVPFREIKK